MSDPNKQPKPEERSVTTRDTTTIDGVVIPFAVTASTLHIRDDAGVERASIFSVAWVRDDGGAPADRPVTFLFNGGPGSSAVWLQFGVFAPRRVDMQDTVATPPAPYRLVDNPMGLLDQSDLVFVDPVGTGFSRAIDPSTDGAFHDVASDIDSVGRFILAWLSCHQRWASPKFVAGESYGTTRGAGLANWLAERGVHLNGLVLVSLATDFQTFVFEPGNEVLPCVTYLPTFAAVAAYHGVVRPEASLDAFLAEAERFAIEEYAPALLLGARLPADRRDALADRLAAFTGLDADELRRRNLRIHPEWFPRALLGAGHRTVGRLDGRYVGADLDANGVLMSRDPSYDAASGPYTVVVNDFLRRVVGWTTPDDYRVLSIAVNSGWRFQTAGRMGYVNTSEDLRKAMITGPHLHVLVQAGIYDLATPYFSASYMIDQLGVPEELRCNVRLERYPAGHMMYFHPPSLRKMRADLVAFYQRATRGAEG